MKLSPHFDSTEFACKCGCRADKVSPALVSALETLRAKIGHPITINSGMRCMVHNRFVGGSPSSQHIFGRAADIAVGGMTGDELYWLASTIPAFKGFGVAGGWLHVDVRPGAPARWKYDRQGRVVAWPKETS